MLACTGPLGAALMRPLLESHHEVVALLRNGRNTTSFSRMTDRFFSCFVPDQYSPVSMAYRHKIPVVPIDSMDDSELSVLKQYKPDLILCGGFSIILNQDILDLPAIGCLNCHSSFLPKHRGPNPFSEVVLQKENVSAVTFHWMTEGIDDGDIVSQFAFPVADNDTGGSVYYRATDTAGEHILEVLQSIEEHPDIGEPQEHAQATYDPKRKDEDWHIDWTQDADDIGRLIRAGSPFSPAWFLCGRQKVFVTRASIIDEDIAAQPGAIIQTCRPVCIATGKGFIQIDAAYVRKPRAWVWPGILFSPKENHVS